ncbi:SDR family NAD(P)-dependent oxidoreductase [Streptomyces sp. 4N509B]|uniref:SDR family NAD(P)-dependent oxidoreductase n=1 Tax=Streptomyces sp. 4N509B TaxID=3457413 RepID=UPI003FD22F69
MPPAEPRTAVVTGANRGVGRELVRQLAARGWTVVLGSRSPEKPETGGRTARAVAREAWETTPRRRSGSRRGSPSSAAPPGRRWPVRTAADPRPRVGQAAHRPKSRRSDCGTWATSSS